MSGGFYLFMMVVFGITGGMIGRMKGSSFFIWFVICFVVPFGVIIALLYRVERDEPQRACPGCGKVVPLYQALCTRCGTELDFTDQQIPSERALTGR